MKRIVMSAMVFVMMLVTLAGCFWWGPEGCGWDGRHYRGGGGHDRGYDRGGGHEERR